MKRFQSVTLLMSLAVVTVARQHVSTPIWTHNSVATLRGGAGPLSAKDTAKIATYFFGVQGGYAALAPNRGNEHLGIPSNPLNDLLMRRAGLQLVSIYLLGRELVMKGANLNRAVGISIIPYIVGVLQSLLNGDLTKVGLRVDLNYALLLFWSLVSYTTLTESKYAEILVKVAAVLGVGLGVAIYLFPKDSLKFFGVQSHPSTAASRVMVRSAAVSQLIAGIIVSSLVWGKNTDAVKAFGYGWVLLPLSIADELFLNKDVVEFGLKKGEFIFFLVFHSILAALFAF